MQDDVVKYCDVHNKHIMKAEKYLIEIHNVTSHIRGWVGSFEYVTKCDIRQVQNM